MQQIFVISIHHYIPSTSPWALHSVSPAFIIESRKSTGLQATYSIANSSLAKGGGSGTLWNYYWLSPVQVLYRKY